MLNTGLNKAKLAKLGLVFSPLIIYWLILFARIPESFNRFFHLFSPGIFALVFILYCFAFHFSGEDAGLVGLLTMGLLALTLSYRWTSGFSDNFMIGGLLPYKDARNYYVGANMLLNGMPIINTSQATERPLFPSFLVSLFIFTNNNLKLSLALSIQTIGLVMFLSARQIRNSFGVLPAGLFITLLYYYIQPWVGYSMSEILGFLAGCLGFSLLWLASQRLSRLDFFLGLAVLLVSISARAGAFFVFPMLIIWAGWAFRREKRYSLRFAAIAMLFVFFGYWMVNTVHARMLGIPPGSTFGNFSYALYGQVRGGTGWYSAIRDLGTRNPDIVYQQAFEFFLAHPLSLFIGIAKAYRDFFFFNDAGIFPFGGNWHSWLAVAMWFCAISLLIYGTVHLSKFLVSPSFSLLLAGFVGIFLSIPFLPPIDGGSRFYAGTMPFFMALPAVGLFSLNPKNTIATPEDHSLDLFVNRALTVVLFGMVLLLPWGAYRGHRANAYSLPVCPAGQEAFVVEVFSDSYIDLTKDSQVSCTSAPTVCLNDFERNNIEKNVDDFYQTILSLMENEKNGARLFLSLNLLTGQAHYFYSPLTLGLETPKSVTGCAVEVNTQYQSIYQVQSIYWGTE